MNYASFAEHTERYTIDGITYSASANFNTGRLSIRWDTGFVLMPLEEYENFDGNMEDFIKEKFASK